jgi:MHS family proline/betaine transporter-like MFS transporter
VPTFLTATNAMLEADALWLATIAGLAVILVTPLFGYMSDRVGRKPVLLSLCVASALLPAAMFALMGGGQPVAHWPGHWSSRPWVAASALSVP